MFRRQSSVNVRGHGSHVGAALGPYEDFEIRQEDWVVCLCINPLETIVDEQNKLALGWANYSCSVSLQLKLTNL